MKSLISCVGMITFSMVLSTQTLANNLSWVQPHGDCYASCRSNGQIPVSPGRWKNSQYFYVCISNLNGEGPRPGYNLEGRTECVIGYGGEETFVNNYSCLCH